MDVSFEQGFLTDIGRIDEKVVIESWEDLNGERRIPHVICQGKKMQVCLVNAPEGNENSILRFYYNGGKLGFMISERTGIYIEKHRTIFEFNLPIEPKAIIESKDLPEDTKILEGLGTELGCSLYKDISVSSDSLVWKESLGKYAVDRGLQDKHSYDVELLDTKSGQLEERPIRFKSYTGIIVDQGNWEIETIKTTVLVKHDVYSEISDSTFLVWDSPMIDAKVDLEVEPVCINNIGKYLDPLNVVFGNTDCFQFTNYGSTLRGFRLTGTESSKVAILFNKESSNGSYTEFECVIGSEGVAEVRIPEDLPYYHFNGIETRGPSKITKVETILNIEESVDQYTPNPDKTYLVRVKNKNATIVINGYADYIEYEKYLGTITEIGRGKDSITDIPELSIEDIAYSGDLHYRVDKIGKQIKVGYSLGTNVELRYTVFQLKIQNNLNVNGNIITTSELSSDYKIKIEQGGFFWKLVTIPDYVNGDDNLNVYVTESDESSYRSISIFTNYNTAQSITPIISGELSKVFNFTTTVQIGVKVDGVYGTIFNLDIYTKSRNRETTWRPKDSSGNPFKVGINHTQFSSTGLSFYLIQLREIKPKMEIWEETLPGKYTKIDSSLKIYNSMTKSFVVVEKVTEGSTIPEEDVNWYYYDLVGGQNKFYLTNYSGEVTNSGYIYFVSHDTTLLDLGTGVDRAKYGRLVNVNRSDLIDGLGTLTVTESSEYPGSWRNVVDNNTVNAEVERIVDNVYVQVGQGSSSLRNEDLEIEVDSIQLFRIRVLTNFKYTIEAHGYLKIQTIGVFVDEVEKFSGYGTETVWKFGLFRLDEEPEMGETYIVIRSANVVRKVTLKVVDPKKEHDYLFTVPPSGPAVDKPNLIRIFENGATSPTSSNKFYYKSYTTPSFTSSGVNTFVEDTTTYIGNYYYYHETEIPLSISNSKSLSRSKYPIKSFGYIQESSLSYSDGETYIGDTSLSGPLKYQLYMKGKEHYLWCVDSLSGVSDLVEPEGDVKKNMAIDASGGIAETFYVVSRYSSNNRTFMTETPTSADYKIVRDELEANIKILSQQNIGLDGNTQIEYATPIQVSSNMPNTGGNIFLGKVRFCAKTRITDGSIDDVIDIDEDIAIKEGIDETYIKDNIVKDKTQYLDIMIFQLGTNPNVLNLVSEIPNLDIFASTHYMIPEVGSNYTITSMTASLSSKTSVGDNICRIKSSSYDSGYFLVEVESDDRVDASHWFDSGSLPQGKIVDTAHILSVEINYVLNGSTGTHTFSNYFTKYGCNIGLYVNGKVGLGVSEEYVPNSASYDAAYTYISKDGGSISIVAGILDARGGVGATEALHVPEKYEFVGANKPLSYSWVEGNVDGTGNLTIEVPPRARDDQGYKEYILKVTQDHKYYPMSLYIVIAQEPSYGSEPDTDKKGHRLMFLDENKYIYSDGTIEGGDKFYFVSNLTKEDFDNTSFEFDGDGVYPSGEFYYDYYHLEEIGRSYEEGYVQFKFTPNGSRVYMSGKISAMYHNKLSDGSVRYDRIGNIHVEQGYFCLAAVFHVPKFEERYNYTRAVNWIPRISPVHMILGYIGNHPRRTYLYWPDLPCKSNNNNSDDNHLYSRCVLSFSAVDYDGYAFKKEYFDTDERILSLDKIFSEASVMHISPINTLESYGLDFILDSSNDSDALVNPRFNNGYDHATYTSFSGFTPYVELNYVAKEDYIREYGTLCATCRITLDDPDRGGKVNFYYLFGGYREGSTEPQNISLFKLSDDTLNFDYRGGTKQVSFAPASFASMLTISQMPGSGWVTVNRVANTNYLTITASENRSTDDNPAFFRTGQVKIDVIDDRDNYVMGSFYINVNQEPDIAQTSGGSGGGATSTVPINITLKNNRSEDISLTGDIRLLVTGTDTAWITAILPGTNPSANNFTVGANSSSIKYAVECAGFSEATDPNDFLGGNILACDVFKYNSETGEHSILALKPYELTRDDGSSLSFEKNKSYTITFTNPPTT